ncbi:hypothetical protein BT63DRAFT_226380 [Microthyrium microscopicum]|uniref:Uncharacterized protein n=1 Tax=Microthyrium microscopicum TaxID=703497 RepID=A0A6A6UEU0_9PEZI|nr:hypothetical protein BT63DRAFT_226380 [Microthyrium microscopicum]
MLFLSLLLAPLNIKHILCLSLYVPHIYHHTVKLKRLCSFSMSSGQSVLFLTNCEFGQSNVVLAVIYELLRKGEFDVHVASWAALETRVLDLSGRLSESGKVNGTSNITFHTIPGLDMFDAIQKNFNQGRDTLPHKPGYAGTTRLKELAPQMLAPWNQEEHISMVDWFKALATALQPAVIVVDPLLSSAHDMCRTTSWKYTILSPCSLASGLIPAEQWLAGIWKYPWQVKICPISLVTALTMV